MQVGTSASWSAYAMHPGAIQDKIISRRDSRVAPYSRSLGTLSKRILVGSINGGRSRYPSCRTIAHSQSALPYEFGEPLFHGIPGLRKVQVAIVDEQDVADGRKGDA